MAEVIEDLQAFLAYAARTTDYEQKAPRGYDKTTFDLDRVVRLVEAMGRPHDAVPAVHVAGSKGKGSIVRMLEALAAEHGLRSGAFTSPHLTSVTERIRIAGKPVDEAALCAAATRVAETSEAVGVMPTFFELMYLMAGPCFADAVDLAIYEVGVGGRLDATNTLDPVVSVISTIDLDHTHWLGDTLELIALEKAGILRPGTPAVIGPGSAEATDAIVGRADELGTPVRLLGRELQLHRARSLNLRERFIYMGGQLSGDYRCPALGPQVASNAALALAVLETLGELGLVAPDSDAARAALARCRLPGRIEPIGTPPRVVLDAAHTPRSGQALANALADHFPYAPLHLVTAFLRGKPVTDVLEPILDRCATVITTQVPSPRSMTAEAVRDLIPGAVAVTDPEEALHQALAQADLDEPVVVTGSFYLAGLLRPLAIARLRL